jgi:RNA polymerase sigma-70 factor (ECF subfamily)
VDFAAAIDHNDRVAGDDDLTDPKVAMAREERELRIGLTRYFRSRIRDSAEVEDLVQEVFTRIAARKSGEPVEHLHRYVFQTAASVLTDRLRRRGARKAEAHVPFDPERHGDADMDPHRTLSGKEDLRAVTAALYALPVRTRTIFVLHRLEGLKYREIAAQLGISVSATEKHMVRAVEHLAATFRRRG